MSGASMAALTADPHAADELFTEQPAGRFDRIEVQTSMASFEDYVRRQTELIRTRGWAVTIVLPTEDPQGTPFAYTVGLTALGRPELIIAGIDPEISAELLDDLAQRVYDQAPRFTHGQRISDLLAGYDAVIVEGPATEALHPGAAFARYGRDHVTLQQVVWPDPDGRFPWEPGYTIRPQAQPTLGQP
jgi:hypothetical protein